MVGVSSGSNGTLVQWRAEIRADRTVRGRARTRRWTNGDGVLRPRPHRQRDRAPYTPRVDETRGPVARSRVVGIVDDDPSLLRALRRLLQAVGFTVETFESGEEFFRSLRPRPNCLVLDIHLGAHTGFDLHEWLVASGASVPTVFITGQDDDATRERARQVGAVAYLCKPFNDQSLISAIELALAQS